MPKYTKIPSDTFQHLQLNAGVLVSDFDVTTGTLELEKIIGATTGGLNFNATPEFVDFGEDIDNCPNNMLELKKLTNWTVELSGTWVTLSPTNAKMMIGTADVSDVSSSKVKKITPRNNISLKDYETIWWVGDYGEENDDEHGGFVAIELFNALSTGGFQMQSEKGGKGTFPFTMTGHYSMKNQDEVPYNIYIREAESVDSLSAQKSETKVSIASAIKKPE